MCIVIFYNPIQRLKAYSSKTLTNYPFIEDAYINKCSRFNESLN